jgi:hypothetical protein
MEQLVERLNCRGYAAGGWASAARRLIEPAKAASLFGTNLAKPWRTCQ